MPDRDSNDPRQQLPGSTRWRRGTRRGSTSLREAAARRRPAPVGPAALDFDHNRLTRADKIVAGGTFVAMISIWLPWFSISWGSSTFQDAGSARHQRDDRARLALA